MSDPRFLRPAHLQLAAGELGVVTGQIPPVPAGLDGGVLDV